MHFVLTSSILELNYTGVDVHFSLGRQLLESSRALTETSKMANIQGVDNDRALCYSHILLMYVSVSCSL